MLRLLQLFEANSFSKVFDVFHDAGGVIRKTEDDPNNYCFLELGDNTRHVHRYVGDIRQRNPHFGLSTLKTEEELQKDMEKTMQSLLFMRNPPVQGDYSDEQIAHAKGVLSDPSKFEPPEEEKYDDGY